MGQEVEETDTLFSVAMTPTSINYSPDKAGRPDRLLNGTGINFRSMPPTYTWCPPWGLLSQS